MASDKVREAAERWAESEVAYYRGGTLDERIKSWMDGGVHPDDIARFVTDAYDAGYRAALDAPLAAPSGGGDAPTRDAVAEVLAPLVAKARRPVPKMDGSHNQNPADLAIAREMADAVVALVPKGGDATPSAREIREACVKHVADAIAACYRRAWTSPDEMRGATGALKRLAVSMANLPLPPAPAASTPADDAVARAREAFTEAAMEAEELAVEAKAQQPLDAEELGAWQEARRRRRKAYFAVRNAERAAKGGEKEATQGTCSRCGYLAMPPACTKCYSPYPAPAPRDGGAKGGSEGGERG